MHTSAALAQQSSHQLIQDHLRLQHQQQLREQQLAHIRSSPQPPYSINLETPEGHSASLPRLPLSAFQSSLPSSLASASRSSTGHSIVVPRASLSSSPSRYNTSSQQPVPSSSVPPFVDPPTGDLPVSVFAHLQQLHVLSQHLTLDQLAAVGVDQQTIATLVALNAVHSLSPSLPLPSISSTPSPPSTISSSPSPTSSHPPALAMSYKSDYSKRHRDGDSSAMHKRKVDSHATTPSSASDNFSPSPRRRRVIDRSGDEDDRGSDTGSDNDSEGTNSSETADDSPLPANSSNKKRTEEEKARNELQRKRQHQKSDKQRRAKIKDGMEQLKALVSLHGKLESPDQASIVSASVDLVHALRQEISGLKSEVERTRSENAAMKQRGLAGYAGLDAVMRGQLGALGQSPLGQLQLSQLSSLQALNSQLSSLNQQQTNNSNVSQQQLSGLNTLNNINMLSSLGLPTNINATATQYQATPNPHHHNQHSQQQSQSQPHQGIHSPLPMMPMQSPPPLSMPASHGSNGFTSQFLTHSPPATGMMYGKEWQ